MEIHMHILSALSFDQKPGNKKSAFMDALMHHECGLSVFLILMVEKSPISIHRKRAALDKKVKVKEVLLHHSGRSFPVILMFYILLRPSILSIQLRKIY